MIVADFTGKGDTQDLVLALPPDSELGGVTLQLLTANDGEFRSCLLYTSINRVHASSAHLPYRKAAYAASGLKMTDLEFDGQLTVKSKGRFNLALDSLALYTNAGFKASMTVTLCMLALALAELVYTLAVSYTHLDVYKRQIHSYEAKPTDETDCLAFTVYGGRRICAAATHGSVLGCQFHPEKSGEVGSVSYTHLDVYKRQPAALRPRSHCRECADVGGAFAAAAVYRCV